VFLVYLCVNNLFDSIQLETPYVNREGKCKSAETDAT